MSLVERIKQYGERARAALIDSYAKTIEKAKQGKAQWLGYDSQGNGLVRQEGKIKIVRVIGNISLTVGSTVLIDGKNTIQVARARKPELTPVRSRGQQKTTGYLAKSRPLLISTEQVTRIFKTEAIGLVTSATVESVSFPWIAKTDTYTPGVLNPLNYNIFEEQRSNYYTVVSKDLLVAFGEKTEGGWADYSSAQYNEPRVITAFSWTFYQASQGHTAPSSVVTTVNHPNYPYLRPFILPIVTIPPFMPQHNQSWFEETVAEPKIERVFSSSDGRYLYCSIFYSVSLPRGGIFSNFYDVYPNYPNYLDIFSITGYLDTGGLLIRILNPSIEDDWGPVGPYTDNPNIIASDFKGLYWRLDTKTEGATPEFTILELKDIPFSISPAANFLNNLYPEDPYYQLWDRYDSGVDVPSIADNAENFIDPNETNPDNDTWRAWPPNLVYYEDTGLALFTARLARNNVIPNGPTVYNKIMTENLSYFVAATSAPYLLSALTTHEDMITAGWDVSQENSWNTDQNEIYVAHRLD